MKPSALSLSLGLALLAGLTTMANAADWNYGAGSIKDVGSSAIPVPAPVPVPIYHADYYFRADMGFGTGDTPAASESGYYYGGDDPAGPSYIDDSWLHNNFDPLVTFGVGVGMYWTDSFRVDVTAETRSQDEVRFNEIYDYEINGNTERVRGSFNDITTLRGGLFLANAYYDFHSLARFNLRPYIGGGVGFAWNELERQHRTTEIQCTIGGNCPTGIQRADVSTHDKTHSVSFAAAATVGTAYKLSHNATLDLNYRFLYIDGADIELGINGPNFGGQSTITIDETYEHQLRAGVRYDIN